MEEIFFEFQVLSIPKGGAVIITGSSRGLGRDLTYHLSERGWTVFACVRSEIDAQKLQKEAKNPAQIVPILLDITQQDLIDASLVVTKNYLNQKKLRLVGLINNAGYNEMSPLEIISKETLIKQFDVNVFSQVEVTKAFLPLLRESTTNQYKSRVIFISSGMGRVSVPIMIPYCASKAAIETIADGFRMELNKSNIEVIVIQPGSIKTDFKSTGAQNCSQNLDKQSNLYCSEQIVNDYRKMVDNFLKSYHGFQQGKPLIVSETVELALTDSHPYTRYQAGFDASILTPIYEFVPERITDFVLTRRI